MQEDRLKNIPKTEAPSAEHALRNTEIRRPTAGPTSPRAPHPPTAAELTNTSFSFETARPSAPRAPGATVNAERIRQLRLVLGARDRAGLKTTPRPHTNIIKRLAEPGPTILDRFVTWLAMILKTIDRRIFSRPDAPRVRAQSQADLEKIRREKEEIEAREKRAELALKLRQRRE